MKQTVEEVAREAAEDCYECHYDDSLEMRLVKEAFRQGAEWQSKQSPWISVQNHTRRRVQRLYSHNNILGTSQKRQTYFIRMGECKGL